MKRIELGQTVAILANFGIIAGIVFLAVEIGQNSDMIQSQTRNTIAQSISENSMYTASSAEIYELWWRGQNELEELTALERGRFSEMVTALLRIWENTHYQFNRGLLEEAEFAVELEVWRVTAATEWFRLY